MGDKVLVMVKEIDDMNRVNLTRRRILENEARISDEGLSDVLPAEKEREEAIAALAAAAKANPSPDRIVLPTAAADLTGETGEAAAPDAIPPEEGNRPPMEVPVKIVREGRANELPLPEYATPFLRAST